jgi:hypothetical protein
MKLSKENKALLTKEIEFVIKKMSEEEDPKSKLYYFTAVHGMMSRIFNIDYSDDLNFVQIILNYAYSQINTRIQDPDKIVRIPDVLFDKLAEALKELLEKIEKGSNLYEVLKKFALIGYVATGNGYYLYQRGALKI